MPINKNIATMMEMSSYTYDKLWDLIFATLSNFSWTQEQAEKMAQTYIEQRKINRDEATKIMKEILTQTRNNQQKIKEIVEEGINSVFSDSLFVEYFKPNHISKKLDELEKRSKVLRNLSNSLIFTKLLTRLYSDHLTNYSDILPFNLSI